jgi:drug/metabolite transporter superfamily protein YnfA
MNDSNFLENIPIAIAASALSIGFLLWRVKTRGYRSISWPTLGVATAMFGGVFAAILVSLAWQAWSDYLVPDRYRYAALVGTIALCSQLALQALLARWISPGFPGNPMLRFCLWGGLESAVLISLRSSSSLEAALRRSTCSHSSKYGLSEACPGFVAKR